MDMARRTHIRTQAYVIGDPDPVYSLYRLLKVFFTT